MERGCVRRFGQKERLYGSGRYLDRVEFISIDGKWNFHRVLVP